MSSLKGSSLLARMSRGRCGLGLSRYLCTVGRLRPNWVAILRTERPSWAKRWMSKTRRRSIIIGSYRLTDDLPDGGRITLLHVLRRTQADRRDLDGCRGEREHLKELAVKGDESLVD